MSIKLFNKGKRTIIHGDFRFKPEQSAAFTPEVAAKLKRLYPQELISLEDEVKRFDVPAESDVVDESAEEKAAAKKAAAKKAAAKKAGSKENTPSVFQEE